MPRTATRSGVPALRHNGQSETISTAKKIGDNMIWKVTGGEDSGLVVELRDDGILFWTQAVTDYFHDTLIGKTIFDDVAQPPLLAYEATSDHDNTAAFLNACLYLPKCVVEGDPPVQLSGDDCIQPEDSMDQMRATVAAYWDEEDTGQKNLSDPLKDQARQDPR